MPHFSAQDPPAPPFADCPVERALDLPEEAVGQSDWDRHRRRVNWHYTRFMHEHFSDATSRELDDWINPYYAGYLAGFKDRDGAAA